MGFLSQFPFHIIVSVWKQNWFLCNDFVSFYFAELIITVFSVKIFSFLHMRSSAEKILLYPFQFGWLFFCWNFQFCCIKVVKAGFLASFLLLEGKLSSLTPLRVIFAVDFIQLFIMMRWFPCVPAWLFLLWKDVEFCQEVFLPQLRWSCVLYLHPVNVVFHIYWLLSWTVLTSQG